MAISVQEAGSDRPDPAPTNSGKYHILTELGRGGMAVVHAAIARGLAGFTKLVVLKKARPELADEPDAVRTFLSEARISARMNHPNVVQVYEVYEDGGLPVIVMEYLDGQPLSTLLDRHFGDPASSPRLPLSVLCQALEGLQYAHTLNDFDGRPLNLIHRDVTPHNIMVTYGGQVKLLDFGIAKLDVLSDETKSGLIKGKLGYMPPEQVEGEPLDCRADLFSIGVIIWEVVAKQRMWGALGEATVVKRLLTDDLPSLREVAPSADPDLVRIFHKATASERDARYGSAQELFDDLRRYLEARGGIANDAAIAQWINASCADLKEAATRRMGERLAQFSRVSPQGWGDSEELTPGPAAPRPADGRGRRREIDLNTADGYAGETMTSIGVQRPRRWPLFVGGAALLGAVLAWQGVPLLPREAAPTPVLATSLPPPAAPSSEVRLRISAKPAGAVLFMDGEPLPANPYVGSRVRDDRVHELAVRAEGFRPQILDVRLEGDLDLNLTLEPEAVAPPAPSDPAPEAEPPRAAAPPVKRRAPPRAAPERPAPQAARPAPAPAPRVNCNPPYRIDSAGIKRYRVECL